MKSLLLHIAKYICVGGIVSAAIGAFAVLAVSLIIKTFEINIGLFVFIILLTLALLYLIGAAFFEMLDGNW